MALALAEARAAAEEGDVPVGAVLVRDGVVLASDHNRREETKDPTAHAEMLVLRAAAARLGGWRLTDATLYVTLEPCAMCAGALVWARVARVVAATRDPKAGGMVSRYHIGLDGQLNHTVVWEDGPFQEEAAALLRGFFQARRS